MVAHRNSAPPTREEQQRIEAMLELGCVCCELSGDPKRTAECHHITSGHRRYGHWYTLNLCAGHHRGDWIAGEHYRIRIALSDGPKRFREAFGAELELWAIVQGRLGLEIIWPESKIVPRRVCQL